MSTEQLHASDEVELSENEAALETDDSFLDVDDDVESLVDELARRSRPGTALVFLLQQAFHTKYDITVFEKLMKELFVVYLEPSR